METTLLDLDIAVNEDELLEMVSSATATGLLRMSLAFRNRHGENTCIAIQRLLNGIERSYSRARHELQLMQKDRFNNITVDELLAVSRLDEDPPEQPAAEEPTGSARQQQQQQTHSNTNANIYTEIREDFKSNPTAGPKNSSPDPIRGR